MSKYQKLNIEISGCKSCPYFLDREENTLCIHHSIFLYGEPVKSRFIKELINTDNPYADFCPLL